jgi:hypothetical protein
MKTAIGVVLGVVIGVIIVSVVTAVLIFNVFDAIQRTVSVQTPGGLPVQKLATPPAATSIPSITPSLPLPPTGAAPSNTNTNVAPPNVVFKLNITAVDNTGLTSRNITGQITNTGNVDAHNVTAKAQVLSQGSVVKVNNQDYITQFIGTVKAGETVSETMSLSFNIMDVGRLTQSGATVNLSVISDEKTQTFTYNFQP